MNVIVTCGPGSEPIDDVRRITNASSGELGVLLSEEMAGAGHSVHCLKGLGATHPGPRTPCQVTPFQTNEDLLHLITSQPHPVDAIFMVAALCDYKVDRIRDANGQDVRSAKIASRGGSLQLDLIPATKVIAALRPLFPDSLLVGWKYELEGTRDEALSKAWRQLKDYRTNLCVLNGHAAGSGFTVCEPPDQVSEHPTKPELATFLRQWMETSGRPRP